MSENLKDHEAAARQQATANLHASLNEKAHVYFKGLPVLYPDCPGCALIAAALSEAVRVAVAHERRFLISCPWCGEKMNGAAISSQITHLIDCGDKRRARTDTQATPEPRRKGAWHPDGRHHWNGRGGCSILGCEIREDGSRGTPTETGEKEPSR